MDKNFFLQNLISFFFNKFRHKLIVKKNKIQKKLICLFQNYSLLSQTYKFIFQFISFFLQSFMNIYSNIFSLIFK